MNVGIIAGCGAGAFVVLGVGAYLMFTKKKANQELSSPTRELSAGATPDKDSQRFQVEHQAIHTHVEKADMTMVVGGDYSPSSRSPGSQGEYYDGSGYVMLDAAEPAERQMSLLMHYVSPPGKIFRSEEIEGDDYGLHQQIIQHSGSSVGVGGSGVLDAEGNYVVAANEYATSQPPATPNVEYFLAEEVIDGTETTQATPIDHAYVENAIGYHQAQLEHRIRLEERNTDSFPPMSPMLTLTGAGGEEVFLDHSDFSIYEPEGFLQEEHQQDEESDTSSLRRRGEQEDVSTKINYL